MNPRLWVTGVGLVTPLGAGAEATWGRLVRGERALRPIRLFDASAQRASIGGEVDGVVLPDGPTAAAWSRTSAMAAAAAAEAMRAAGVDAHRDRVGLVVGGTTGGMFENERVLARLHAEPDAREMLVQMLSHPLTAAGDCIDERLGPFVRVRALASACSSGANALVVAASWLLAGQVDVVVAGGADGLCRLTLSGFNALAALDPEPCRPFHRARRGTNLGEGAAFLVLERAERAARRRGDAGRCIAELAGWAVGAEAHHITNPAADGALVAALIGEALDRAGLSPREVDYVNAHGTGTVLNDAMEATALSRALGAEKDRVPVSSCKGQIGHTLGAAGAIEAAVTALAVSRRTLPPTAGLDDPDPALGLVHVPGVGVEVPRVRAALSNAFGFGGMDTVLVFTEPGRVAGSGAGSGSGSGARAPRAGAAARSPSSDEPLAAPEVPRQAVVVTGASVFGACGLLGVEGGAELAEGRAVASAPVDPDPHLDVARSRRLDRAARLAAAAVQEALRASGLGPDALRRTGAILGSAYGNVDGSAAFMHRIFDRGPRAASPADFPNLVPSSPAGHVSIYLGLQGPTFATADLATSGESAFAQAADLIAAGVAGSLVAGAVEPRNDIVERVLAALFAHAPSQAVGPRTDLAVAIALESEESARRRGARVLARIRQTVEWRGSAVSAGVRTHPIASLRPPRGARAELWIARPDDRAADLLAGSPWADVPRRSCAAALGESDALGAAAIALGALRVAAERADEVLVLGVARGRGHATVLGR